MPCKVIEQKLPAGHVRPFTYVEVTITDPIEPYRKIPGSIDDTRNNHVAGYTSEDLEKIQIAINTCYPISHYINNPYSGYRPEVKRLDTAILFAKELILAGWLTNSRNLPLIP